MNQFLYLLRRGLQRIGRDVDGLRVVVARIAQVELHSLFIPNRADQRRGLCRQRAVFGAAAHMHMGVLRDMRRDVKRQCLRCDMPLRAARSSCAGGHAQTRIIWLDNPMCGVLKDFVPMRRIATEPQGTPWGNAQFGGIGHVRDRIQQGLRIDATKRCTNQTA